MRRDRRDMTDRIELETKRVTVLEGPDEASIIARYQRKGWSLAGKSRPARKRGEAKVDAITLHLERPKAGA